LETAATALANAVVGSDDAYSEALERWLDLLLGRLTPSQGSGWLGPGVVVGELGQRRADFFGEQSLLHAFNASSGLLPVDARTLLAKLDLGEDHIVRSAQSLSPGKRTRTSLAMFQARGANCLVLDQPPNHLDMPAIEQLESALETFAGTLLLVTHDRRLLDAFAPHRIIELMEGQVRERHT